MLVVCEIWPLSRLSSRPVSSHEPRNHSQHRSGPNVGIPRLHPHLVAIPRIETSLPLAELVGVPIVLCSGSSARLIHGFNSLPVISMSASDVAPSPRHKASNFCFLTAWISLLLSIGFVRLGIVVVERLDANGNVMLDEQGQPVLVEPFLANLLYNWDANLLLLLSALMVTAGIIRESAANWLDILDRDHSASHRCQVLASCRMKFTADCPLPCHVSRNIQRAPSPKSARQILCDRPMPGL